MSKSSGRDSRWFEPDQLKQVLRRRREAELAEQQKAEREAARQAAEEAKRAARERRKAANPVRQEEPDDNDPVLFRQAVGAVRPVHDDRSRSRPDQPKPRARQTEKAEASVRDELLSQPADFMSIETGEELRFIRDGHDPHLLKRLRRGDFAIEGELDLHDMTAEEAKPALARFFSDAQLEGARCLRVIHGKGLRSGHDGPVLKNLTNSYLRRRSEVIGFVSARPNDGGTGAVYVLLSRL